MFPVKWVEQTIASTVTMVLTIRSSFGVLYVCACVFMHVEASRCHPQLLSTLFFETRYPNDSARLAVLLTAGLLLSLSLWLTGMHHRAQLLKCVQRVKAQVFLLLSEHFTN